eukprot:9371790-Lingulodinium_polyedra.AAC.1
MGAMTSIAPGNGTLLLRHATQALVVLSMPFTTNPKKFVIPGALLRCQVDHVPLGTHRHMLGAVG